MLGKLLKYEFKATSRMFLPLYGALVVFAIINRIFLAINAEDFAYGLPAGIAMTVYVFIIVAIIALTFLVMIQRFYKNLLGDEGYLMFTLPVAPSMHITSKMIASIVWSIVSGIVTVLSVLIIVPNFNLFLFMQQLMHAFISTSQMYGANIALWFIEAVLSVILTTAAGVLIVYLCIAVGNLAKKHKILTAFGCYIAITTVVQTVITIALIIFDQTPLFSLIMHSLSEIALSHLFFVCFIIMNLVIGAVCFYLTNFILTKNLNLE